tara:strand:+ start:153 stop:383 length:231 start_codon:yes stop_codon:yes gene_type:complete
MPRRLEAIRRNAIDDAAEAMAEYLHIWSGSMTQEGMAATMLDEVGYAVTVRLVEMADEAAQERALELRAEQQGARY